MNIADLIAHFEKGAAACEAYSKVEAEPPMPGFKASSAEQRNSEHYAKRAKWHRDAAKLLLDLSQSD